MALSFFALDSNDQATFWTVIAFAHDRFTDLDLIEWALQLKPTQSVERMAILHALNGSNTLPEPWISAWRLIEESWSHEPIAEAEVTLFLSERLKAGDRSGPVISQIISLVEPYLEVESIRSSLFGVGQKSRRPKTVHQLLSADLASGTLLNLNSLRLPSIKEVSFLMILAKGLEAAMDRGLDIARRIGWDGKGWSFRLGLLHWAGYIQGTHSIARDKEPDTYNCGIAPVVKLLNAVVMRLAELEQESGKFFMRRWFFEKTPVHLRLWAAIALESTLASTKEVEEFVLRLNRVQFWDIRSFPEIAKLRALHFSAFSAKARKNIIARIRRGPPHRFWPKDIGDEKIKRGRIYWITRELQRIRIARGSLPPSAQSWLEENIKQFGNLSNMTIEEGFFSSPDTLALADPGGQYDLLQGVHRLRALESAFSADPYSGGDSERRASNWLREEGNVSLVLDDLESVEDCGDSFPHVWGRFGEQHKWWHFSESDNLRQALHNDAKRVLRLIEGLSDETLSIAIGGISSWLESWKGPVATSSLGLSIWFRVWPIAVAVTNAEQEPRDEIDLTVPVFSMDDSRELKDPDVLNTPLGRLVEIFLTAFYLRLEKNPSALSGNSIRRMRDTIAGAGGRSELVAKYQLIQHLPYLRHDDSAWADKYLVAPLREDSDATILFWRAVAPRTGFTSVMEIIGTEMADIVLDRRLGRKARQSLVFSLVIESLRAFRENRMPAVVNSRVQQILRAPNDEIRIAAAKAVKKFVDESSWKKTETELPPSAAGLFRSSAAPFFQKVWPQERSLSTPDISRELARLPAASKGAFAEAVGAIERFLVPFQCRSMEAYNLSGFDGGAKIMQNLIDNQTKAKALLKLLDLTIKISEDASYPYDLTDALDQIKSIAPNLVKFPAYRRLSTMARH